MKKNIIIFIIALMTLSPGQDTTRIYGVSLDVKRNGLFVQIHASKKIKTSDVTGWQAKNKWFYITIINAWADSVKITSAKPLYPIQEIQAININNTVQLGFKMNQEIEYFEFYPSDITPGMILSLHFPVKDVMVALKEERNEGAVIRPEKIPVVLNSSFASNSNGINTQSGYSNIRNSCYLLGIMLTASGYMESKSRHRSNIWETATGLSLITLTFTYDKLFRKDIPEMNE